LCQTVHRSLLDNSRGGGGRRKKRGRGGGKAAELTGLDLGQTKKKNKRKGKKGLA